jgi:hypothetical protein
MQEYGSTAKLLSDFDMLNQVCILHFIPFLLMLLNWYCVILVRYFFIAGTSCFFISYMLNVVQMHLDPLVGAYFDFGNHTEKVRSFVSVFLEFGTSNVCSLTHWITCQ